MTLQPVAGACRSILLVSLLALPLFVPFTSVEAAAQSTASAPPYETLFYTHDGLRLEAYLYKPAGEGPFPLVVYNHGSRPGEERTEWPVAFIARLLVPAGFAVLVPERRGYGKSDGVPFAQEIGQDRGPRFVARQRAEAGDVNAALEHILKLPGVSIDESRIAIMGWSFGGIVTTFAAADSRRYAAVVVQAPGALNWIRSEPMRNALVEAARSIRVPTHCAVAENDLTTESARAICAAVSANGTPALLKVYPKFESGRERPGNPPGHALFGFSGVDVWRDDLLTFLFAGEAQKRRSAYLAELSWLDAQTLLTEEAVVVMAIGSASKAHGPHLPLSADFLQAEYVKDQVARRTEVVVAPSVGYGFYPPFVEYAGSTTLPLSVARDLVASICRSYARSSSARRFYVISHGNITRPVFEQAAKQLESEGILLRFTDWEGGKAPGVEAVKQQERGSHADEVETSMLLHIAPGKVDMAKAVKEYGEPAANGGYMIGNRPENNGVFSPSAVFGDATLATPEKGRRIVDGLVDAVLKDIEALRAAPLPRQEPQAARFAGFEGVYELGPGQTVSIRREGDMLALEREGKPVLRLQYAGRYHFGLWATEARFFPDDNGAVTHMVLSENGRDLVAKRIKQHP